jgi:hypothetical protein
LQLVLDRFQLISGARFSLPFSRGGWGCFNVL